jgi:hypothetical protein
VPAELGKLPADQIVSALPRTTWFSAVGTPLDASERAACRRYLRGLGAESCSIETVPSWYEAIERARKTSWWTTWWERERAEERALFAQAAAAARSTEAVVLRLANLMQGSHAHARAFTTMRSPMQQPARRRKACISTALPPLRGAKTIRSLRSFACSWPGAGRCPSAPMRSTSSRRELRDRRARRAEPRGVMRS